MPSEMETVLMGVEVEVGWRLSWRVVEMEVVVISVMLRPFEDKRLENWSIGFM